jgi:hypothetical protein
MQTITAGAFAPAPLIRTLRHKVHPSLYPWLNRAAIEVNQVWNQWDGRPHSLTASMCQSGSVSSHLNENGGVRYEYYDGWY